MINPLAAAPNNSKGRLFKEFDDIFNPKLFKESRTRIPCKKDFNESVRVPSLREALELKFPKVS